MSLVALSGVPVVSGTVIRPLVGPWVAELELDGDPAGGELVLGTTKLAGTVVAGGTYRARTSVRVVGGAGKLGTAAPARFFRGLTLRSILSALLQGAGESLSSASDAGVVGRSVDAWTVSTGTVAGAVALLVSRVPGACWRVLADGSVWVGVPTWAPAALDGVVLDERRADGLVELALDSFDIDAGTSIDGRRVRQVRHIISPESVRTFWWTDAL